VNKVLILGASGLLGRYVCAELAASGLQVYAQSRSPHSGCDQVFDPVDAEVLRRRLSALRPQAVVNLAALTSVDYCEQHLGEAYRVNTAMAESLAAWVSEFQPDCHVVQISTDQVYARTGYQKEADVDLLNVYALTKYAAEIALRGIQNHTVLRTNFFGRSRTRGRESFSDWIYNALVRSTPIRLAVDIQFNPLSLPALARYIAAVVQRPVRGVFNLGSRSSLSKHEFGLQFARALSVSPACLTACTAAELAFQVRRPLDMRMDVSKSTDFLGPLPDLESEIERAALAYIEEDHP
jgi:dTDP-4-dehydrorhamnose reductase